MLQSEAMSAINLVCHFPAFERSTLNPNITSSLLQVHDESSMVARVKRSIGSGVDSDQANHIDSMRQDRR